MARQQVKRHFCDRCPVNKAKPATHRGIPFGFGEQRWKIDLCDQHYDMLSRDFYAWGLMAEAVEIEPHPAFMRKEEMRRAADLRAQQVAQDRTFTTAPPISLPLKHREWGFTDHALERLAERELDVVDVLWACCLPEIIRPGLKPGVVLHLREPVSVALDPQTKSVLTVGYFDEENRKAVAL